MSNLLVAFGFLAALTYLFWRTTEEESRLKSISIVWVVFFIFSSSMIQTEWAYLTTELVSDSESSHDGLPDLWDDKQVLCFDFPADLQHPSFDEGRHFIDHDGTEFLVDEKYNGTGVCVGGFSDYENGFDFLLNATAAAGGDLEVGYTIGDWGPWITTFGGLDPATLTGDFSGAYWSLYHNGDYSLVGIGDLIMGSDDVLQYRVDYY